MRFALFTVTDKDSLKDKYSTFISENKENNKKIFSKSTIAGNIAILGTLASMIFGFGYTQHRFQVQNRDSQAYEDSIRASTIVADKYDSSKIAFHKTWNYWYDSTFVQSKSMDPGNCWHTQEVPYTLEDSLGTKKDTFKIVPYNENHNMIIDRYYAEDSSLLLTVRLIDLDDDSSYDCVDSIVQGNRDESGMIVNDYIKRVWTKDNSKFNVGLIRYVLSPHSKMHLQDQEPSLTFEDSFYYTEGTWCSSSKLKKTSDEEYSLFNSFFNR